MAWLYVLIFLLLIAGLVAAYRILGTPSRLAAGDYNIVLADVATSVERAAGRLRQALDTDPTAIEDEARGSRKIFQTGYYQTLRLRPTTRPDAGAAARAELGRACEAYDWASRMIGSESARNPIIMAAASRLLDAGDAALKQAALELPPVPAPPGESSAP